MPLEFRPHAPDPISAADANDVVYGQFLCGDPLWPCWNIATMIEHRDDGRKQLRCDFCRDYSLPATRILPVC